MAYTSNPEAIASAARRDESRQREFIEAEVHKYRGQTDGVTWAGVEAFRSKLERDLADHRFVERAYAYSMADAQAHGFDVAPADLGLAVTPNPAPTVQAKRPRKEKA